MKRNFKLICFMIAVIMMLSTMSFSALAVDEAVIADSVIEIPVCGDDCADLHDEEEPGGRNVLCFLFGCDWSTQSYPETAWDGTYCIMVRYYVKCLRCGDKYYGGGWTYGPTHVWTPKPGGGYICKNSFRYSNGDGTWTSADCNMTKN